MQIIDLPLDKLQSAPWNSNTMDVAMLSRLRISIKRYGLVENLVVRKTGNDTYEVISGNQRLDILRESGYEKVPCVVLDLDDGQARLLAQALNHIRGQDDLGLRADLMRKVLETVPESEILSILPETAMGLEALTKLGTETMAQYLQNWQDSQHARLKHRLFQLTPGQLDVIEEAINRILPQAHQSKGSSPNLRGTALFLLSKFYLEHVRNE